MDNSFLQVPEQNQVQYAGKMLQLVAATVMVVVSPSVTVVFPETDKAGIGTTVTITELLYACGTLAQG